MAVLKVPVTKGKDTVDFDLDTLPDAVYQEALLQGLKVLVNRGMSKVTKEAYPNEDEMKAAAMAKAIENAEAINKGDIKFSGEAKKKDKISGPIKTEAMRLARNVVKDELKKAGYKISHIDSSEITAMAKEYLAGEEGDSIIAMATANLEERAKAPTVAKSIISAVKVNPKKVAAAEEKKKNKPLSAKQAGKVATRAKGKPAAQATVN